MDGRKRGRFADLKQHMSNVGPENPTTLKHPVRPVKAPEKTKKLGWSTLVVDTVMCEVGSAGDNTGWSFPSSSQFFSLRRRRCD